MSYTKLDETNNIIRYIRHDYIKQNTETTIEKILKKDNHSNIIEKYYIGNPNQISGIETFHFDYYEN